MLISEKTALAQLINTAGTTASVSGFAAFFRSGSSSNIPRTFLDLVATSRAACEYKVQGSSAETNGQLNWRYIRSRDLLPLGGYGSARTLLTRSGAVKCVAVYPEFTRFVPALQLNKTVQQIMAQAASLQENTGYVTPQWTVGDSVEYDFGRTLRFRSIFNYSTAAYTNFDFEYQTNTGDWVAFLVQTMANTDTLDFSARKIRIRCKTATTEFVSYTFYAEKGSAFAETDITHAVLVPLTIALPHVTPYLGGTPDDYLGLVLDVGTDITISPSKTGKPAYISANDLGIRLIDNYLESVQ